MCVYLFVCLFVYFVFPSSAIVLFFSSFFFLKFIQGWNEGELNLFSFFNVIAAVATVAVAAMVVVVEIDFQYEQK